MIKVVNKKQKIEKIRSAYPNALIFDVTSSSPDDEGRLLSPFFPHCHIPIPGDSREMAATCVEAIWQGLKVFEGEGIDIQLFQNDTMKNIKRTVRKNGKPLGHQFGVYSSQILDYANARRYIYVPTYLWVLENVPEVRRIIDKLKNQSQQTDIILLDYNVNPDIRDLSKPLSHAELIKRYLEDRYPSKDEDFAPYSADEKKNKKPKRKRKKKAAVKENTLFDLFDS